MTAVKNLNFLNCSPSFESWERGVTAVKNQKFTNCSPTSNSRGDCSQESTAVQIISHMGKSNEMFCTLTVGKEIPELTEVSSTQG